MKTRAKKLMVVGAAPGEILPLLPLAQLLARAENAALLLCGLVPVAPKESLSSGARAAQQLRQALKTPAEGEIHVIVRVAHDIWQETRRVLAHEKCDTMLIRWSDDLALDALREMPCDVIISNGILPDQPKQILLPVRGGPHAALALEIALVFAHAPEVGISLLHATPPARFRDAQVRELFSHLRALPELTQWLRVRGDAVESIVENAQPDKHQLLVMGAVARPQRGDPPIGPTAQSVLKQISIPALVVKSRATTPDAASTEPATPVDYTISVVVDKWFAENTFHAHEFENIQQLVELKTRQSLTISLGLPTLNEEATIGNVIKTVRAKFVREYPLLDEIVVIDSNSTDRTVEIATEMGVPVFKHPEVLTQYGVWQGKGEALWNSLYLLKGDLIAWIDTDIVNMHPRFVYGILGPLIREPHLMYVKGFYQRPLRLGRKMEARGGGRVTELTARPLLNLFYPELSGFVQPLAGEYAGRRGALEAVPFFVGYGVETGLLIDILNKFGLSTMGQVDLEERVHRNQSLHALSKMAFEITQVVMQRVGEARGVELISEVNKSMKLIRHEAEAFQLDVADIRARERPPMLTIPEYRALRGLEPFTPPSS